MELTWLEKAVLKYKILVDTSALMSDNSELFFYKYLAPILSMHGVKIIVPHVVYRELENNRNKLEKRQKAEKALRILEELLNKGLVDIRGEQTDTHPDQVFRRVYAQHCTSANLMFITNDKIMAKEICNMHNSQSIKTSYSLLIVGILQDGKPYKICQDGNIRDAIKVNKQKRLNAFVKQGEDKPLKVTKIPVKGDYVYCESCHKLGLTEEIARGGEGFVFRTDKPGVVVKIYREDRLTTNRLSKIRDMSELEIKKGAGFVIAWPEEVIYNEYSEFVGFAMPEVIGKTLQEVVFTPASAQRNNLSRIDLVNISINLLKAYRYLHMKGVLIGDINPLNVLLNMDRGQYQVCLIDTDSFQINGYRTEVGTLEYIRPSLLKNNVNFKEYSRTPADEAFAVAVMVFRILMLGKHPFSYKGGEDVIENMKEGKFPYKLKDYETDIESVPTGPWKYIWSHIHPRVREKVADAILERISINSVRELVSYESELISALDFYRKAILDGKSVNELIPYYIYLPENVPKVRVSCAVCGYQFDMAEDFYKNKILARNKRVLCGKHLQTEYLKKKIGENVATSISSQPYTRTQKSKSAGTHVNKIPQKPAQEESFLAKLIRFLFG